MTKVIEGYAVSNTSYFSSFLCLYGVLFIYILCFNLSTKDLSVCLSRLLKLRFATGIVTLKLEYQLFCKRDPRVAIAAITKPPMQYIYRAKLRVGKLTPRI